MKNLFLKSVFLISVILFSSAVSAQQVTNHAIPIGRGPGVSGFGSALSGATGQLLAGVGPSADPTWTATPTLGVAGTTVGKLVFANATSGSVTIQPTTGALGTAVLSLPAATDTLVGKATTDTLTNKTFDTAGTGNSFKINGTAITAVTGTNAVVLKDKPELTGYVNITADPGAYNINLISSGSFASPGSTPATLLMQDYSVSHAGDINIQAINSAGVRMDNAFKFNAGFTNWDAGHEQSDIDLIGYRNGSIEVMANLYAGCLTAYNNNGFGALCPADIQPGWYPGGHDNLYNMGGYNVRWRNLWLGGTLATGTPATKTGTSYTVGATDSSLILNPSGAFTLTLPTASTNPGRWLHLKLIAAQTVVSASSNVVPLAGGAAGTAILAATAGKWAALQSDGSAWQIMMSN